MIKKKKESRKNYKILIGVLIGLLISSIGVYAATAIASEIKYTNNGQENVEGAINDLYNKSVNHCPEGKTCITKNEAKDKFPICKRATKLHTEECNSNDGKGCKSAGYTEGATITYGNLGTKGTPLASGDALDCDVNLDGTYDANTERFYYVSEYYNTETKSFENDTAVLIYYNNTTKGISDNTIASAIAYNEVHNTSGFGDSWYGPETAKENLPTTNQWVNVNLKNTSRNILNEQGGNTLYNGSQTIENPFSYSGYAARLITAQEINKACNIMIGNANVGELNGCQYLLENLGFSKYNILFGYWIEEISKKSNGVFMVHSSELIVSTQVAKYKDRLGVRPAIEVPISRIEY